MERRNDEASSSTQFIPMHRPHYKRNQNQSSSGVVLRQNRNTVNPRPHSIGASIISNPKLVKGWQYYDNSPNQKSIQKYLSSVTLPYTEDTDSDGGGGGGSGGGGETLNSNSTPNRDSYRRGVGLVEVDDDDDYIPGVEVKACVASDYSDEDDDDIQEGAGSRQYLGIILTLIASSAIGLLPVLVECLPKEKYHSYSVTVWAFQGIFLPSLLVYLVSLCWGRVRKEKGDYFCGRKGGRSFKRKCGMGGLLIVRALFGWLGVVLKVSSLRLISLPDSTLIAFTFPIFVLVAALFYLKEKVGVVLSLLVALVLIGAGIIVKPPLITGQKEFYREDLTGIAMSLGCMLLIVFSVIILRYIRSVHYALVTFIYGLLGTIGSLVLCFVSSEGKFQFPKNGHDWGIAIGLAGLTFIGQNLITIALKYETAGIFSIVRTWEIPVTFIGLLIIRKEKLDYLSIIGSCFIVLAIIVVFLRRWLQSMPKSRKTRRLLRFLLI